MCGRRGEAEKKYTVFMELLFDSGSCVARLDSFNLL